MQAALERGLTITNLAALGLTLAITATVLYRILLHPLRNIPGPFAAKLTELWRTGKYVQGNWHKDILALHKRYGPVVRVSPNEVSIVDKDGINQVYGHGKNNMRKTSWYDVWKIPGANDSFFNSTDPAQHAFFRKRVSGAFSMSTILSLEPEIQANADLLWSRLDEFAERAEPVDMNHWAAYFAFDVVGKMGIGSPIGFLEQGRDVDSIIASIHDGFWYFANLGYIRGQQWWVNNAVSQLLLSLIPGANSFAHFQAWNVAQVTKRKAEEPAASADRKRDMLDYFIDMREPDGQAATIPSVLIEIGNLIGAGADTTAIGICSVLKQLVAHQPDLLRIREEVDDVCARAGGDKNSIESGHGIPYISLEKLPHLAACIKEALRLHPSILWQLPRESPAAGVEIAGHYIPPSATISMSPIAQNRDRNVFGSDADKWRPQRWIVSEKNPVSRIREMDKYMATFGFGARVCIGRNLALVEIHKFVAEFCRRYDSEFVNKETPYVTKSQWFSYHGNMLVKLSMRKGPVM